MNSKSYVHATLVLLCALLAGAFCQSAAAKTLCVNPGGTHGCYSTITKAVAAASAGDVIVVAAGEYDEAVTIDKPLSLIGAGAGTSIIDAESLSVGVYVDGRHNPGLHSVIISGFTVENSNFEGILVTNASNVTIRNNSVLHNDLNLDVKAMVCVGQPTFETDEGDDCGEGIHFMGVNHSIIANNIDEHNSGGILLSDDTGQTHNNLVTGNLVEDNALDCGITLASHPPAPHSTAPHNGVVHNTIAGNSSIHNGYEVPGAGAGVGIFSDGTGPGLNSGNVVIHNQLMNNGIPGVALHSHVGPASIPPAKPDNLSDNIIVGNFISGNGADKFDTATPGTTGINVNSGEGASPIYGTIIAENVIENEDIAIAFNTPAQVNAHINNLINKSIGVDNLAKGTVDATENWWGCSGGPGVSGCSIVKGPGVVFDPWLFAPIPAEQASPSSSRRQDF
jgi:hypothetical protein